MTATAAPIGLYDSGLGGLSVVREVLAQLPAERLLYLGDTARVPYGPRSVEELVEFNREILAYLASEGAKAILVACNTSCATALDQLRDESPVPVIGLIGAGARSAARAGRRIAVLATEATICSDAYRRALLSEDPDLEIVQLACPDLVPLVERGLWESADALAIVRAQLAPLANQNIDAAVLGCTHFPLLAPVIGQVLGPQVALVNPAIAAVQELACVLGQASQLSQVAPGGRSALPGESAHQFVVTGDPDSFAAQAARILGSALPPVRKVFLETLRLAGNRLLAPTDATAPVG